MDKPSVETTSNGVSVSLKKEGDTETGYNTINLEDITPNEYAGHKRSSVRFHRHEVPRTRKFLETGRRTVITSGFREEGRGVRNKSWGWT